MSSIEQVYGAWIHVPEGETVIVLERRYIQSSFFGHLNLLGESFAVQVERLWEKGE